MEPSREVTQIAQVAALDNEIFELHKKRAKVLQELNYTRCPIISQLSSEVLSRVFRLSTHTDSREPHFSCRKALFRLRAVCSHWHRVVESSPQLWTTLILGKSWKPIDEDPIKLLGLLSFYLQRLGGAAMSLHVHGGYTVPATGVLQLLLKDDPGKLRSLHFQESRCGSDRLTGALQVVLENADAKLSRLEELELDCGGYLGPPGKCTLFHNCPRLRTLSLSGSENRLELPWEQITTLKLKGAYLGYSFHLLSLCPNLVSFESSKGDWLDISWVPPQSQIVVSMESLQDMTWINPNSTPDVGVHVKPKTRLLKLKYVKRAKPVKSESLKDQLFAHFRFPVVRKLHWNFPLPSDAPFIRDFFANMQELEELRISLSESEHCIGHYLNLFGNLTTLTMDITSDVNHWLWRLTIKPGNGNLVPRLEKLSLHLDLSYVRLYVLTLMLYSRRNGPVDWLEFNSDWQHTKDIILPPYDPTSKHWRRHARLLEFSTQSYDLKEPDKLDWTNAHYEGLKAMMLEAKELEGFGERTGRNRILF